MVPMESIREVKKALTARSETRSLDELQSRGRSRVKVIRAEHIAAMIDEAVQRAIAESGLVSREEADRLAERSREEFAAVHAERAQDAEELAAAQTQLEEAARRREALEKQVASLEEDIQQLEAQLAQARQAGGGAAAGAPAASGGMPPELMIKMMEELAALKARVAGGAGSGAPGAAGDAGAAGGAQGGGAADALTAALDKLANNMNDRLEQFGRKMGISSAVEADAVKLDSLFSDVADQEVESNLDTMEVKQRQTGGIAANLARLKKLKGGD